MRGIVIRGDGGHARRRLHFGRIDDAVRDHEGLAFSRQANRSDDAARDGDREIGDIRAIDEQTGMKNYIANERAGIMTSAQHVRRLFTRSIELGRSYGRTTTVLGRTLPGIVPCQLWQDLAQMPAERTVALVIFEYF